MIYMLLLLVLLFSHGCLLGEFSFFHVLEDQFYAAKRARYVQGTEYHVSLHEALKAAIVKASLP